MASDLADPSKHRRRRARRRVAAVGLGLPFVYLVTAYILLPFAWTRYEKRHPAFDDAPGLTETASGIPGDPLNVALIGSEHDLKKLLLDAGWFPADPLTLKSCLEIASDTALNRPYDDAPVSSLYLWGRKEDLAFEQPVGDSPRKRHHVRFWRSAKLDQEGRPLWFGSATFDERVGLSDTTGQVTHHIAPDVDAERDHLFVDLKRTREVTAVETIPDFHDVRSGRNGGGDPWRTDGGLLVATILLR